MKSFGLNSIALTAGLLPFMCNDTVRTIRNSPFYIGNQQRSKKSNMLHVSKRTKAKHK